MTQKGKFGGCQNRVFDFRVVILFTGLCCACLVSVGLAELTGANVLVLVNAESPASAYIGKLYLQYHPDVPPEQVLHLTGLSDCANSTPDAEAEIITRQQYESLIAQPVRTFLLDPNHPERLSTIRVIVTTAGMPYRIEDTTYGNVIYPAGSNPGTVSANQDQINAASVESELTCLWYSDYAEAGLPFGTSNRMVNPYQGYRGSSITLFEKLPPGTKTFNWTRAFVTIGSTPKMEGQTDWVWPVCFGTTQRQFGPGDMYLTCRLDGPKTAGESVIFSVRALLERARCASDALLGGVNPAQAVVVLDDSPGDSFDYNKVYNLDSSTNYVCYDPQLPGPPDCCSHLNRDDYTAAFSEMTGRAVMEGQCNTGLMANAFDLCVVLDRQTNVRLCQMNLDCLADDPNLCRDGRQGVVALATFGTNGEASGGCDYLLTGGPDGASLFHPVNGAVFTSMESFNAVTMCSDATTSQCKIVDFVEIGGCGAIGHAFEPMADATIDNYFFFYNLFADEDDDAVADLTYVEAAFTAIPYLSWSEVTLGDPLMRVAYGPGGDYWVQMEGDLNRDGVVNVRDVLELKRHMGGSLTSSDESQFDLYNDLCDLDRNGLINIQDVLALKRLY